MIPDGKAIIAIPKNEDTICEIKTHQKKQILQLQ